MLINNLFQIKVKLHKQALLKIKKKKNKFKKFLLYNLLGILLKSQKIIKKKLNVLNVILGIIDLENVQKLFVLIAKNPDILPKIVRNKNPNKNQNFVLFAKKLDILNLNVEVLKT